MNPDSAVKPDSISEKSIACIVTAYNPSLAHLEQQIRVLSADADCFVVDNSTQPKLREGVQGLCTRTGARFLDMGGNVGLGAAQNAGIRAARSKGYRYVLFMDDDSMPDRLMLSKLLAELARQEQAFGLAIVTPIVKNVFSDVTRESITTRGATTRCDRAKLMSSGTLTPLKLFDLIGPLDEILFVDYVDYELGWRAQAAGIPKFVVHDAILEHSIGEGDLSFLGLKLRTPSPIRHYFQFRNTFLLWRRKSVPMTWKISRALLLPIKFLLLYMLTGFSRERLTYAMLGIKHGLSNIGGPFQLK